MPNVYGIFLVSSGNTSNKTSIIIKASKHCHQFIECQLIVIASAQDAYSFNPIHYHLIVATLSYLSNHELPLQFSFFSSVVNILSETLWNHFKICSCRLSFNITVMSVRSQVIIRSQFRKVTVFEVFNITSLIISV